MSVCKPVLIIIDGTMGAGKTTVSKLLHKRLKYSALISLDKIKHIISGVKPDDSPHLQLASEIGAVMVKEYLKRSKVVIVEKAFTMEKYLKGFVKMVNPKKIPVLVYQLDAPFELRVKRVKERPLEFSNRRPTMEKLRRNCHRFANFRYKQAKMFDSSKITPQRIVNHILKDLSAVKEKLF